MISYICLFSDIYKLSRATPSFTKLSSLHIVVYHRCRVFIRVIIVDQIKVRIVTLGSWSIVACQGCILMLNTRYCHMI